MIIRCSYDVCAGLDAKKIEKCMGDPDADADNPVLKEEQDAQVIVSRGALKFNKFYHILIVYDILSFDTFHRLGKDQGEMLLYCQPLLSTIINIEVCK